MEYLTPNIPLASKVPKGGGLYFPFANPEWRPFENCRPMATIRQQIHNNAVALISLFVAISSLGYNTWRNEKTEEQRNLRHAAFTVLENLGEMQEVVDARYYYLAVGDEVASEGELRLRGYGSATMTRDLMALMPGRAPEAGEQMLDAWGTHFAALDDTDAGGRHTPKATEAERALTEAIQATRSAVIAVLHSLE